MWVSEAENEYHNRQDAEWRRMKLSRKKRRKRKLAVKGFHHLFETGMSRFWKTFNLLTTESAKLMMLKRMAKVTLNNPIPYEERRAAFAEKRFKIKWICGVCGTKPDHRHHIIPLKNGGPNWKHNLIALCEWCHSQVHPWMPAPEALPESMEETMQRVSRDSE